MTGMYVARKFARYPAYPSRMAMNTSTVLEANPWIVEILGQGALEPMYAFLLPEHLCAYAMDGSLLVQYDPSAILVFSYLESSVYYTSPRLSFSACFALFSILITVELRPLVARGRRWTLC